MLKNLFLFLFFASNLNLFGADTLSITLKEAEGLLLQNNLQLLAKKYNIDVQSAYLKQSKLFSNPNFSSEWSLYNPSLNKWLDIGPNGQKIIAIEKSISVAGQRNKKVAIFVNQKNISELEFLELASEFKLILHQEFFNLYFLDTALITLNAQISLLTQTLNAYETQFNKGNISLKEIVRLQATLLDLNGEKTQLEIDLNKSQELLKNLLIVDKQIKVAPKADELLKFENVVSGLKKEDLVAKAMVQRPDIAILKENLAQSENVIKYEKSLAIPDLSLGYLYDQAGSYTNNYNAITLGFAVPLFNRNQGNIAAANSLKNIVEAEKKQLEFKVKNEVERVYNNLVLVDNELKRIDNNFIERFNLLNSKLIENFSRSNISLLEFTDLFETYYKSVLSVSMLKVKRYSAFAELNYVVGEELFK